MLKQMHTHACYLVYNRGNPRVVLLYPYPTPPNTLPLRKGMVKYCSDKTSPGCYGQSGMSGPRCQFVGKVERRRYDAALGAEWNE